MIGITSCTSCSIPHIIAHESGDVPAVRLHQIRDLSFAAARENTRLQFRSEFFNFTNTPYFGAPNGISFQNINSLVPDGPRNGEIRSLRTPMRIIQFSLKLSF